MIYSSQNLNDKFLATTHKSENIIKSNEFYESKKTSYLQEENLKSSNFKDSKTMFNDKTNQFNKFDEVWNYKSNPENNLRTNEFYEPMKTTSTTNSNYFHENGLKTSNFKDSKVMFNDKTNQFDERNTINNYKSKANENNDGIYPTSILKNKPSEILAKYQEIPRSSNKYTDSVTNNQWEPPSFLKVFS